jgi:hypothetical protein
VEENRLPDNYDLNNVPVRHPETGEKIYLYSRWFKGFWYKKTPGRGDGQVWPCQYYGELLNLEVWEEKPRKHRIKTKKITSRR